MIDKFLDGPCPDWSEDPYGEWVWWQNNSSNGDFPPKDRLMKLIMDYPYGGKQYRKWDSKEITEAVMVTMQTILEKGWTLEDVPYYYWGENDK